MAAMRDSTISGTGMASFALASTAVRSASWSLIHGGMLSDSALAFMDDAGIDVAVTSISTPGVHTGNNANLDRKSQLIYGKLGLACLPQD